LGIKEDVVLYQDHLLIEFDLVKVKYPDAKQNTSSAQVATVFFLFLASGVALVGLGMHAYNSDFKMAHPLRSLKPPFTTIKS